MYNMAKRKQQSWDKLLTAEVALKLKEVGHLLREARKHRAMSVSEAALRIGVDRRTLTQLEKGSPKVSLGIFFQALSFLNLLRSLMEILQAENDLRKGTQKKKAIDDSKVNF